MADKTTTLKTKTNDNVYPNVIGDNRDNAISDSAHIKHTLTADHKINFRLDDNVSNLIFNSLQKPSGLTKTKLVGVGTIGQENIEIGDNLTLANGKLSATGGGSVGDVFDVIIADENVETYTGTITGNKPVIMESIEGNLISTSYIDDVEGKRAYFAMVLSLGEGASAIITFEAIGGKIIINESYFKQYYTHFITLTDNTSTFYLTYQNTSNDTINTINKLKTSLAGKSLICTGHTDSDTAEHISGEGGNIVVGVVDNSNHSTRGITIDSSFTITDLVTPVE